MAMTRLRNAGHYPRDWAEVDSYPDVADYWGSTQATMARIQAGYSIAAQDDPELPCQLGWEQVLGIRPGVGAHDAAARIVTTLTGFVPTAAHRGAFAATLASGDGSVPGPGISLTAAQIEANLTETVAQVLASPYFALR